MTRINHFFVLLVFLITTSSIDAQNFRQKIADSHFDRLAYSKAVTFYEDLAEGKKTNLFLLRRAAICNQKMHSFIKAEYWCKKMTSEFEYTADDALLYAQMLLINEKYEESLKWFDITNNMVPNSITKYFENAEGDYYRNLIKDSANYTVKLVGFNSEQSDFSPTYYNNQVVFTSGRRNTSVKNKSFDWDGSNFLNIYQADESDNKTKVDLFNKNLSSKYHEGPVAFNQSFNEMYLTRSILDGKKIVKNEKRINHFALYFAQKDENNEWTNLIQFPYCSPDYSLGHATLSEDGNTIYFVSDMPGGYGNADLWKCKRKDDGEWDKPINLGPEINTIGNEMFPYLDGNDLYFSSNGHLGLGGLDLYVIKNHIKGKNTIINMGYPLNSSHDDFGLITKDGGMSGYSSSEREGNDNIYAWERKILPLLVNGYVYDKIDGKIIPQAKIFYKNEKDEVEFIESDSTGYYELYVLRDINYEIAANKENYDSSRSDLSTFVDQSIQSITKDIELNRELNVELICLITDKNTNDPLESVTVDIGVASKKGLNLKTDNKGVFRIDPTPVRRGDILNYQIKLEKEGYITKEFSYSKTISKDEIILLHKEMDFTMVKIAKGVDLGKIVNINPIYFDFNKHNILPEAAIELDKIIKVMSENKDISIELGSHTDCRGKNEFNKVLSGKRAKSSVKYIVSQGISKERIKYKGYGESKLKTKCRKCYDCSEEEHQLNRRTEFLIID